MDFTVPNTLKLKQRTPGHVYVPYEVREKAENLKNNKFVNLARVGLCLLCMGPGFDSTNSVLFIKKYIFS